jgi:hypothetical protein
LGVGAPYSKILEAKVVFPWQPDFNAQYYRCSCADAPARTGPHLIPATRVRLKMMGRSGICAHHFYSNSRGADSDRPAPPLRIVSHSTRVVHEPD